MSQNAHTPPSSRIATKLPWPRIVRNKINLSQLLQILAQCNWILECIHHLLRPYRHVPQDLSDQIKINSIFDCLTKSTKQYHNDPTAYKRSCEKSALRLVAPWTHRTRLPEMHPNRVPADNERIEKQVQAQLSWNNQHRALTPDAYRIRIQTVTTMNAETDRNRPYQPVSCYLHKPPTNGINSQTQHNGPTRNTINPYTEV